HEPEHPVAGRAEVVHRVQPVAEHPVADGLHAQEEPLQDTLDCLEQRSSPSRCTAEPARRAFRAASAAGRANHGEPSRNDRPLQQQGHDLYLFPLLHRGNSATFDASQCGSPLLTTMMAGVTNLFHREGELQWLTMLNRRPDRNKRKNAYPSCSRFSTTPSCCCSWASRFPPSSTSSGE